MEAKKNSKIQHLVGWLQPKSNKKGRKDFFALGQGTSQKQTIRTPKNLGTALASKYSPRSTHHSP